MDYLHLLPQSFYAVWVFIFGLALGSFANVCIHRMPRGESVVHPRSRCPSCGSPIRALDNIPVIGYLLLGGKCRACKQGISAVYPLVEFATGALLAATFMRFGMTREFPIFATVVFALVAITMIDVEHKIIPDRITLPGIVFGLVFGSYLHGFWSSAIGLLTGGGLFYVIAVLSRGGMGGGDIKFIAGVGALLGWKKVLLVIFLGSLLGSIVGVALMALNKKDRKSQIPFGPYLALGTLIAIFYGDELIRLYLGLISGNVRSF